MKNWLKVVVMATAFVMATGTIPGPATAFDNAESKDDRREYRLEPVEVTAEKRKQDVQDIPASITTITSTQLEDAGTESSLDVINLVPNLHAVKAGNHFGSHWFFIRGLSGTGSVSGGHTVGYYVDGVYYPTGIHTELFDIERIEVLRGPQGTLYGRNTEAGVINIITKQPTQELEASASAGYETFNTFTAKGAFNTPIIKDKLAARVSLKHYSSDGMFKNTHTDNDRVDKLNDYSGRAQLLWTPQDALKVTWSSDFTYFRDGYSSFAPIDKVKDNPRDIAVDYEGNEDSSSHTHMLNVGYEGSGFAFNSSTSYRDWRYDGSMDADFSIMDMVRIHFDNSVRSLGQEFRLASTDEASPLQWLVGVYGFHEAKDLGTVNDLRMGMPGLGIPPYKQIQDSEIRSHGYAAFGQTTYTLFDKLDLTAGLRYDHESSSLKFKETFNRDLSGFGMLPASKEPDDISSSELLPKLSAAYRWTPEIMTYATVSRGYTSGGFNVYVGMGASAGATYDPEYSWNYELGMKSTWLDNRLQFNASVFYIDWEDQQVTITLPTNDLIFDNAAQSTSKGFELELMARPMHGSEIGASLGYTDVTFDKYTNNGVDYSGKKNTFVPDFTYNVYAQHRFESGFFGRAEIVGVGDAYIDLANTRKRDSYFLLNSRVGYEQEHFDVYLYGRNLLGKEYLTRAIPYAGTYIARAGEPRILGLTATVRF